MPHMFELNQVSDVSHRRGGCQKTSAHRMARRSGRCRSSLASGSVFACGGMCGPWEGTRSPHVPCVLLCVRFAQARAIRYTSQCQWSTDESVTIWLKTSRRVPSARAAKERDTDSLSRCRGVDIRVLGLPGVHNSLSRCRGNDIRVPRLTGHQPYSLLSLREERQVLRARRRVACHRRLSRRIRLRRQRLLLRGAPRQRRDSSRPSTWRVPGRSFALTGIRT